MSKFLSLACMIFAIQIHSMEYRLQQVRIIPLEIEQQAAEERRLPMMFINRIDIIAAQSRAEKLKLIKVLGTLAGAATGIIVTFIAITTSSITLTEKFKITLPVVIFTELTVILAIIARIRSSVFYQALTTLFAIGMIAAFIARNYAASVSIFAIGYAIFVLHIAFAMM